LITEYRRGSLGELLGVPSSSRQSPVAYIMPLAQLEADLRESADVPDSKPFMRADATGVG